ncbi:MAG: hypothetical protein QXO98_00575 [Sulfolobales archaeon]
MKSLIPWSGFKVVVLAILTTSIAVSMTGLYVLSVSATLARSLTLNTEGGVLIYSSVSRAPHTGLISNMVDRLVGVEGVLELSPEVLTPVMINNDVVFLRGLNLTVLDKFVNYSLIGCLPRNDDEVLVGIRLSKYLNISVGQILDVVSIPAGSRVRIVVSGMFESNTPLDDEVVSNLSLSQKLRGVGSNYVTLIRVKVSNPCVGGKCLSGFVDGLRSTGTPLKVVGKLLDNRSLSDVELVDEFLGRGISLSSTLLWASMLLVLAVSTSIIYFGTLWSMNTLAPIVEVLRSIGLSKVRLASTLILKILIVGIASGVSAYLISFLILNAILTTMPVSIILHRIEPVSDLRVLMASALLPSITASITICSRIREV